MTVHGHPDPSTLMSYAAGTLPGALAGVVACHISMCQTCRIDAERLEVLGGLLLEQLPEPEGAEWDANQLMTLEPPGPLSAKDPELPAVTDPVLPAPLARYLNMSVDDIPWKKLPRGVRQYWVPLPPEAGLMRLLRAPGRAGLLPHSHRGAEVTLVLTGTYSDHTGDYRRGEVAEMSEGTEHRPKVTSAEECICIVATEVAPRYSQWYARLLRPLLGF